MDVRPVTDDDVQLWSEQPNVTQAQRQIMLAPLELDDCAPCGVVATITSDDHLIVRVPLKLDEIELAQLARGGTIWLSTYGGLPPFSMVVVGGEAPESRRRVVDAPQT